MFQAIHKQFGTAGLILSVAAVVLALAGGAFAASGGLTGKQKKEVKSIAKSFPGPAGPAGAKGDPGAAGGAGAAGAPGKDGASATAEPFSGEAHGCKEGGVLVKSASAEVPVCNGKKGAQGPAGPVCENGECLLPEGATETGIWYIRGTETTSLSISFPLRLPAATEVHPYYVTAQEAELHTAPAGCPGSFKEPKAVATEDSEEAPFCLYEQFKFNFNPPGLYTLSEPRSGLATEFEIVNAGQEADAWGSWALTTAP